MKHLASLAAIMPLFWFNIIPNAVTYCPRDANGNLMPYVVQRENGFGEIVNLTFGGQKSSGMRSGQEQLCKMVADFPA